MDDLHPLLERFPLRKQHKENMLLLKIYERNLVLNLAVVFFPSCFVCCMRLCLKLLKSRKEISPNDTLSLAEPQFNKVLFLM